MKISRNGIELIKSHEGLRLASYVDSAGVWTIGYGHTGGVKMGDVITQEQAEQFLIADLATAEEAINRQLLKLNQNQFDALVSFVFNVGAGNFGSSTLLRRIKENPTDRDIEMQFRRWVYANGKVLPGLVKRRKDESKLYFS